MMTSHRDTEAQRLLFFKTSFLCVSESLWRVFVTVNIASNET